MNAALDDAFRDEWGRVVATLIRVTGDWDLAEECAQDAFARALESWPRDGVPRNPGAWLTTTARHAAVDRIASHRVGKREVAGGRRVVAARRAVQHRRQRYRRRSPPADLHVLPPGVDDRRASCAHAAHARGTHDIRDRARVPRARTHDGAAARARQTQDSPRGDSLSRSACALAARAHERGARRAVPVVQRGLQRYHG